MTTVIVRRPSPLQRRVLIVLAALDAKRPGPVQACHDAGIEVRLQINESHAPEEGCISGTAQVDQTEAWFRQLDSELQKLGITGLTETDRQAVVVPGETLRSLPAPARLLHILRESAEAFPLTASRHETDAGDALDALLAHRRPGTGAAVAPHTLAADGR